MSVTSKSIAFFIVIISPMKKYLKKIMGGKENLILTLFYFLFIYNHNQFLKMVRPW